VLAPENQLCLFILIKIRKKTSLFWRRPVLPPLM